MKTSVLLTLLTLAAFAAPVPGHADPLFIPWFTVDGGGGVSRGGSFAVSGTIGQYDANSALTGGGFTVEPGFWPGTAVGASQEIPLLKIRPIGNAQAIVSWSLSIAGYHLEELTDFRTKQWVASTHTVVDTGGEHTVTVTTTGPFKCYRLKK